jgi:hypothetical protein
VTFSPYWPDGSTDDDRARARHRAGFTDGHVVASIVADAKRGRVDDAALLFAAWSERVAAGTRTRRELVRWLVERADLAEVPALGVDQFEVLFAAAGDLLPSDRIAAWHEAQLAE